MKNYLLDTHVFLWWCTNDLRLKQEVNDILGGEYPVFVSVASAWEVAIKIGLGKINLPEPFEEAVEKCGFSKLPISFEHTERVTDLPHHHRDPFDRMLLAQSLVEGFTLITHDQKLGLYDASLLLT